MTEIEKLQLQIRPTLLQHITKGLINTTIHEEICEFKRYCLGTKTTYKIEIHGGRLTIIFTRTNEDILTFEFIILQ